VKKPQREGYRRAETDPVEWLSERLLLLTLPGYDGYYYSPWSRREYPNVALPAQVAAVIEPASSLDWKPSRTPYKAPDSSTSRAPVQMTVDLELMIGALKKLGGWKVNKGGTLPVGVRNRLSKLLSAPAGEPLSRIGCARLRPFLKGRLGSDCFVVSAEKRAEVRRLIEELGFTLEAPCRLEAVEAAAASAQEEAQSVVRLRRRRR
jgi:hypothetical protein